MFNSIFNNGTTEAIDVKDFLLCIGVSLLLGLIMVGAYAFKNKYTKSFLVTLVLLPSIVCVVIMMVNGNVGAGVAVAGAFSLVRFRSAAGSAKEIVTIFLAMGAGLISGMGYLALAALFTLIMCAVFLVYNAVFGGVKRELLNKTVKITIPEDLEYSGVFDDIFAEYTKKNELVKIKTMNMGSMFRLTYNVTLIDASKEKQMLDRIRERNGNLEITVSKQENTATEL